MHARGHHGIVSSSSERAVSLPQHLYLVVAGGRHGRMHARATGRGRLLPRRSLRLRHRPRHRATAHARFESGICITVPAAIEFPFPRAWVRAWVRAREGI